MELNIVILLHYWSCCVDVGIMVDVRSYHYVSDITRNDPSAVVESTTLTKTSSSTVAQSAILTKVSRGTSTVSTMQC